MWQALCASPSRSALRRCFAMLPRKAYKAALSRYEPKYWRQETNRFRNTPLYIRRNRQICTTEIQTISRSGGATFAWLIVHRLAYSSLS